MGRALLTELVPEQPVEAAAENDAGVQLAQVDVRCVAMHALHALQIKLNATAVDRVQARPVDSSHRIIVVTMQSSPHVRDAASTCVHMQWLEHGRIAIRARPPEELA